MRMSLKMENFCRAYVVGGVAKTAALEAGYSDSYARCRSHELLDHMGVRMGIEQLRREMREHNTEDADAGGGFSHEEPRFRNRYLEVLWAIGSSSMEELIVDGEMVPPDPGSLAWWAIKRWKQVPDGMGGMTPQIELHDKVPTLREFGKATGFNVPLAKWPTGATDKNRGFAPSFQEAGVGEATDKYRSFEGGSDRGIGAVPPQSGLREPLRSDAGPASATGATDKNRSFVGGSDRGIGDITIPELEAPASRMTAGTPAFQGDGAAAPQRPEGRTPTRAITARPEGWTPTGIAAPVVRSWTEQVAMLKREPVEVLEMLVLGLLLNPMWQGKRVAVSQRGELIAELLHAVLRELAMRLVKRLEEESEVNVIPD